MMRIGFIGLGPIAHAMVSRLLGAGHQVTLYDPDRNFPEEVEAAVGSVASSIQDACRWANAVFTMLPDDEAAEAAILRAGGVVENLPSGAVHIGSSTLSVECCDRIVEAHWDAGKEFVSAPVLVTSEAPGELQLFAIAGGSEEMMLAAEPLLTPIGQCTQLGGWPSNANRFQLEITCSGANPSEFLARHRELSALQERLRLANLAFLNLDIGTKGALQ